MCEYGFLICPTKKIVLLEVEDRFEKKYNFGKSRTSKYLNLKHAGNVKVFPMDIISNQPLTQVESNPWYVWHDDDYYLLVSTKQKQREYDRWKKDMRDMRLSGPTKEEIDKKVADLQAAQNYNYSELEMKQMIERNVKQVSIFWFLFFQPTVFVCFFFTIQHMHLTALKRNLIAKLEVAKDNNQKEEYDSLVKELQDLNMKQSELEVHRRKMDKATTINAKHKKLNAEGKYLDLAPLQLDPDLDPFSQRETRVVNYFDEEEKTETKPKPIIKTEEQKRPKLDAESILKQVHDFDLALPTTSKAASSQTAKESSSNIYNSGMIGPKPASFFAGKQMISIAEYKRTTAEKNN